MINDYDTYLFVWLFNSIRIMVDSWFYVYVRVCIIWLSLVFWVVGAKGLDTKYVLWWFKWIADCMIDDLWLMCVGYGHVMIKVELKHDLGLYDDCVTNFMFFMLLLYCCAY